MAVNYIRHLNTFFRHVRSDDRLRANDVSVYIALFQIWNMNKFESSFQVVRQEVMLLSRVGSIDTYIICIRRLHAYGYIIYQKAARRYDYSTIRINDLSRQEIWSYSGPEMQSDSRPDFLSVPEPGIMSQSDPVSGHLNKQLNSNKLKRKTHHNNQLKYEISKSIHHAPEISEVQAFFQAAAQSNKEAGSFFNHYEAIGWTLSNVPIVNWQAAARKWINNSITLKKSGNGKLNPGNLHVEGGKNYKDPL